MRITNREILKDYYEIQSSVDEARFEDEARALRKAILPALIPKLQGKVLCAGWSARLKPTPPGADIFVVVDFAEQPLRAVPRRGNTRVAMADIENLPFDIGTFNTVLVPNLLHMVAEDNMAETDRALAACLRELTRVMKGDGLMIFVEPLMNPIMETMNRALYPILRYFMNSRGRPAKSYYSAASLNHLLFDAGLTCDVEPLEVDEKMGIFDFLPEIRLPEKITRYLWRHSLVFARKRNTSYKKPTFEDEYQKDYVIE